MAINPADITTIRVGELPTGTIDLTSKIAVENGTDLEKINGQDLINFVNTNAGTFQYEIRELWVNQAYIDNNFDNTGLGVNLLVGYALCNGNNGTPPMDGLVSIAYGTNYNVIGAFGGSKDAVVVDHSHVVTNVMSAATATLGAPGGANVYAANASKATSSSGISGTNKNMQPYIVLLKIMKL